SLAVVGRSVFAFLPNIQPVTSLIIICGLLLGPAAAIILALLTTFLSNMLLGMGIWTVWQVVSCALIGFISGFMGKYLCIIPVYHIVDYVFNRREILALLSGRFAVRYVSRCWQCCVHYFTISDYQPFL